MGLRQWSDDFENPAKEWFFTAGAGFDFAKGLARRGRGNAWVRNTIDWNAINIWRTVEPNSVYTASAWLRLSSTLTDGYFSVRNDKENRRDGNFDVINEIKLIGSGRANPSNAGYDPYEFDFETGSNNRVLLYIGLWGVGPDAWRLTKCHSEKNEPGDTAEPPIAVSVTPPERAAGANQLPGVCR